MTKRQSATEPMEDVSFDNSQDAKKQKQVHETSVKATQENDAYEIESDFLKKSIFEVYYMEVHGRAEDTRFLLEYVGANYRNRSAVNWPKGKSETMFGYLPQLIHTKPDGSKFELAECKSMSKYLAVLFGLWGSTIEEEATLDMLFDSITDNMTDIMINEAWDKPDMHELTAFERVMDKAKPVLQGLERFLVKNGSNGYFLGHKTTLPDLALFSWLEYFFLEYTALAEKHFSEESSSLYSGIFKVYQRLNQNPRLRAYIDGGRWKHKSCSHFLSMNTTAFFAKDPEKLHKFYTETLGLNCVLDVQPATGHRYIEYEFPHSETRFTVDYLGENCPVDYQKSTPADSIVLNVRNVFDVHAMLAKKGVEFTFGPKDEGWGCIGEFADPEGNQIMIMSPSTGNGPSA
ncbi:hypothetical protein DFQ27_002406 [Actinomortierella ambigua]|uniref:Uncharacterized protein n=1 Tax=Actinomortierella ambigua TaxID=1343610 RepID=A0A9P6UBS9_9FUNG|nr:hypothetical protein DFQ27_002406 [Actinomortierella ambigua]